MNAPGAFPPPPQVAARLAAIRASIGARYGMGVDHHDSKWLRLPPWFKKTLLHRARLDPLRECMPLSSFEPMERAALIDAANALDRLALEARKGLQ